MRSCIFAFHCLTVCWGPRVSSGRKYPSPYYAFTTFLRTVSIEVRDMSTSFLLFALVCVIDKDLDAEYRAPSTVNVWYQSVPNLKIPRGH